MYLFFQNKRNGMLYHLSKLKLNVNWSSPCNPRGENLLEKELFLVIYESILTILSKTWQFAELKADVGRPGMYVSTPEGR